MHELAQGVLGNADTLRVFMHRAVVDQDFWERGSQGLRGLSATFERALDEHRDEIQHPDPELAIDIAFRFVYDTLARRSRTARTSSPTATFRRTCSCASSRARPRTT